MDQRRVAVARNAPEERPASGRWTGLVVCRRRRLHSWPYRNLNLLQRQEFALENILTVITINSTTTTVRRRARAEHEAGTSHGMVRGEGAAGRRERAAPHSCSLGAPGPGSPCAANEQARYTYSDLARHGCARASQGARTSLGQHPSQAFGRPCRVPLPMASQSRAAARRHAKPADFDCEPRMCRRCATRDQGHDQDIFGVARGALAFFLLLSAAPSTHK